MTRTELWIIYTQRNPHWKEDGANLTANGLQKLFEQVWKHAYEEGRKAGVTEGMHMMSELQKNGYGEKDYGDFADVFKDIFRK